MKPLKIRLQNFGPYVDETVDFTRFFEAPLFLITGATGSGKTTIFDAMCYALFNETSGKKRSGAQLRSDFASPKAETKVEFTFEHQGKIYTIKRWPKQILAGKNGKEHEKKAKVELLYEDAKEKQAITKIPEAKRFIDELLHLTAEQFTKVILLPQGQFRNFLAADSKEKELVLRNLFGSELFEQWTENLRAKFKQSDAEYQKEEQTLRNLMEQADFASETTAPALWCEELAQWLAAKNEELVTKKAELDNQKQHSDALKQRLLSEQDLTEKLTRLATVNEKLATLAAKKNSQAHLGEQLAELKWAQKQQAAVEEFHRTQQELRMLAEKLPQVIQKQQLEQARVTQLTGDLEKKHANTEEIAQQRYEMQVLLEKLDLYQAVEELTIQLKEAKAQADHYLERKAKVATAVEQLTKQLEKLALELTDEVDLKQAKYQVDDRLKQITKLIEKSDDLQQRNKQLTVLKSQLTAENEGLEQATAKARMLDNELSQVYLNKFIKQLSAGKPCPVCGSLEHPHPAEIDANAKISEEDVKQARRKANELLQRVTTLNTSYRTQKAEYDKQFSEFRQAISELTEVETEEPSLSAIVADLLALAKKVSQQQANLTQQLLFIAEKQQQHDKLRQELLVQKETLTSVKEKYQEYQLQQRDLLTRCEEKKQQLPHKYADQTAARERIEFLESEIQAFENRTKQLEDDLKIAENTQLMLTSEIHNLQAQQQTVQTTSSTLQAKITANCAKVQKTLAELEELLAQIDNLPMLEEQVTNYQNELSLVKGQHLTLTEQVAGRKMPDLDQTKLELTQVNIKIEELQSLSNTMEVQIATKQGVYEKVRRILQTQADKLSEVSQLKELVDVISGKGEQKLGFERYILQNYLKEVLVNANERLTQLTNGRYELCLSEEIGRGASSTGLELDIYDEHAGKRRSVHTLSGGESFLVALALALALGEVIQKKSGGVQIEALFVDEGFGSLDQVALQAALETLQGLDGQNRMVGIISHVTELQSQLPYQLQVVATGERSTLRYQTDR